MSEQKTYAVIRVGGKQYKVTSGSEILVDKLEKEKLEFDILLTVKDGKISLGKPTLKKSDVKLKILEEVVKGDKLVVAKYRAKSRYRKKQGFRAKYTKLLVEKI